MRRDQQRPAIVVVVLVVIGTCLSLFGQTLVGELGLALIAIAGGLFATWVVSDRQKRR